MDAFVKHCKDQFIGYDIDVEEASSGSIEFPFFYDRFAITVVHAGLSAFDLFVIFNGSNMSDFDVSCLGHFEFNCLLAECDALNDFDADDPQSFCKVFDNICQMWNLYQLSKMTPDQAKAHSSIQTMMLHEIRLINRFEVLPEPQEEYICYSFEIIPVPFAQKSKHFCLQISFEVNIYDLTIDNVRIWISPLLLDLLKDYQNPFKVPKFNSNAESFATYANRLVVTIQNLVSRYFAMIPKKFILLLLTHMNDQVLYVNFETFRKIQMSLPRMRKFNDLKGILTITFDNPDDLRPLFEIQVKNSSTGETFCTELSTTELFEDTEISEMNLFYFLRKKMKEAGRVARRWYQRDDK